MIERHLDQIRYLKLPVLVAGVLITTSCGEHRAEAGSEETLDLFALMSTVPEAETTVGSEESFGSVRSLALLQDGDFVVADGLNGRFLLFSGSTELDRFGRRGRGPEEFLLPRIVAAGQGDTILALDTGGKLAVLHAGHDSLTQVRTFRLPFAPDDLCAAGERTFVLGLHNSNLVHEINLAGDILNSFGRPEGVDRVTTEIGSAGRLACSIETGNIAFVAVTFGIVRVFDAAGTQLRRDSVPSFSRTVYVGDMSGMRPEAPEIGYTHYVDAVNWIGDNLLIQLLRSGRPGSNELESRWLSLEDGWRSGMADWPRIVRCLPSGVVYATMDIPYPVVRVYRLE